MLVARSASLTSFRVLLRRPLEAPARSLAAKRVTLIPGDGIGPEIATAVERVFAAADVPIEWDRVNLSSEHIKPGQPLLNDEVITSIQRNRIGLKGPLSTPIGKGHVSLNLTLRKTFGLYANVRPCKSIQGFKTRHDNVDVIVIRENTEGEYVGIEHEVVAGGRITQSIKVITAAASRKIANHAFQCAIAHNRKRVTAIHKANIMKKSDGLFLQSCREVATRYPNIIYDEQTLDNACLWLTQDPSLMDVMVLPNLYGDIISDLCAGLIGGLGLTPSGNYGDDSAIFESVHGTAPDIAGQNKANPTALLLSSIMMLRYMGMSTHADRIQSAIFKVIAAQKTITRDLGGTASTDQYTEEICKNL